MRPFSSFIVILVTSVSALGLIACEHLKVTNEDREKQYEWVQVEMPGTLQDDLGLKQFKRVLKAHIKYWNHPSRLNQRIKFNEIYQVEAHVYAQTLMQVFKKMEQNSSPNQVIHWIKENFVFLGAQSKGKSPGDMFMTSYYEPVIPASKYRNDLYRQAIYGVPKDMVLIQMGEFAKTFSHWSWWAEKTTEQKSDNAVIRGRLTPVDGENDLPDVVPYFSRKEIDSGGQLESRRLPLAWVRPTDAFFLQIQGSGVLKFQNGKTLRVGYAAQNGHPYVPVGKFMFDVIPREKMSLQSIEKFLSQLPFSDQQAFMNRNPSYVFFRELSGRGETFMGTEVVDGRTVATDYRIFPKGTLAYLQFQKPHLKSDSFKWAGRFVMDQDTGGAIRGPHRVDLFWGMGDKAKQYAGRIRHEGKILYLFPKSALKRQD